MIDVHKRKRGTAIVETPHGILVVSGRSRIFLLPGGAPRKGESRRRAAIRELREETGLIATRTHYLFSYIGSITKDKHGGYFQNHHKVFLIEARGDPKPLHEIEYIGYYPSVRVSKITREIIERYLTT